MRVGVGVGAQEAQEVAGEEVSPAPQQQPAMPHPLCCQGRDASDQHIEDVVLKMMQGQDGTGATPYPVGEAGGPL